MSFSAGALFPQPIRLGNKPVEGSKVVPVTLPWASIASAATAFPTTTVNLLQAFNTGQFVDVQAIYVDNTTCAYAVQVTANETLFTAYVPPFSFAMLPMLVEAAPQLTVSLPQAPPPATFGAAPYGTTRMYLLNTEQAAFTALGESYSAFQSSSTNALSFNGTVLILPALTGNLHYAISRLQFSINTGGPFAITPTTVQLNMTDSVSNFSLWRDAFYVVSGAVAGNTYKYDATFPAPIIVPSVAAGVNLAQDKYPASGNSVLTLTINFGVVTIQ